MTEEPFEMGVLALGSEPRQLGPYRLLGQLATGGMGVVYLGRNPGSGRLVALKTLLAPGGVTAEARKRFDREVRLARRITGGRTARVLDADAGAPRPWMAMEYVPAPSLQALVVQRGALDDEAAVRWIASGVVQALAELHGKGIVHRDVKPLNTLLTQHDHSVRRRHPDDYQYIVKIKGVHSGDYDCGDQDGWALDDVSVTLCAEEIRQRS